MTDPLDALMAQHGVDPLDALMAQHGVNQPASNDAGAGRVATPAPQPPTQPSLLGRIGAGIRKGGDLVAEGWGGLGTAATAGYGQLSNAFSGAFGGEGLPGGDWANDQAKLDAARSRQLHQGWGGWGDALSNLGNMAGQGFLGEVSGGRALAEQLGSYIPEGLGYLTRAASVGAKGALGGSVYGAQNAITTPTPEGVSPLHNDLANVGYGAGLGGLFAGGLSALGEAPEAIGQGARRALGTSAERQAALDRAAQIRTTTGAEPSLGEVLESPLLKHVENATEYVPLSGRGTQLKANNAALQGALQAEADATAPALGPTGAGDVIANSAKAGLAAKRAPAIQLFDEVREGMANASPRDKTTGLPLNDDGTVTLYHGTTKEGAAAIQSSGKLKSSGEPDVYLTTAQEGTGYGDGTVVPIRVDPSKLILDDEFPNGRQDFHIPVKNSRASVPVQVGEGARAPLRPTVDNTLAAYDDAIAQESGISGKNSPQTKILQAERNNLASGETAPNYAALEKMQDRQQSQAANNYNAADQAQQDVARYRAGIGKAMGADLYETANAVDPALGDKYRQANKIYSDSYDYDPNASTDWQGSKQRSMNRILAGQEGGTSTLTESLLKGDNPDMAKHAAEVLDPAGVNALKADIWDRVRKAGNPSNQGGKAKAQVFTPQQAASEIESHTNFIKQFFSPDEQNDIFGLRDAFHTLARSGQYMENLQTGKFVPAIAAATGLPPAAGLALAGHPATLGMELGSMGAARGYNALSGTPGGKAFLLKPGSTPLPSGPVSAPGSAAAATLARPQSQQEYDVLPPNTPYQSLSGSRGVKLANPEPQYDPQTGFEKFTTQDVDPNAISKGLIEKGNIPLVGRPLVPMGKGSVGSEYSYTIDDNGAKVLIPSIFDGSPHTAQQAIAHYRSTGQHLGKWSNDADADAAAEIIHNRENNVLYRNPGVRP